MRPHHVTAGMQRGWCFRKHQVHSDGSAVRQRLCGVEAKASLAHIEHAYLLQRALPAAMSKRSGDQFHRQSMAIGGNSLLRHVGITGFEAPHQYVNADRLRNTDLYALMAGVIETS